MPHCFVHSSPWSLLTSARDNSWSPSLPITTMSQFLLRIACNQIHGEQESRDLTRHCVIIHIIFLRTISRPQACDDLMMTSGLTLFWSERPELMSVPGHSHIIQMISGSSVCHNKEFFSEALKHWMGLIASLSIFWTLHLFTVAVIVTDTDCDCDGCHLHWAQKAAGSCLTPSWIVIPLNARWPYTSGDGLSLSSLAWLWSRPSLAYTGSQAAGSAAREGAFLSGSIKAKLQDVCCEMMSFQQTRMYIYIVHSFMGLFIIILKIDDHTNLNVVPWPPVNAWWYHL